MLLTKASYEILFNNYPAFLSLMELAGRTCYKSEEKITDTSAGPFMKSLCQVKKHHSVAEHSMMTVRFIVDRGVSHELVRHRIASYSQESTRYVDYHNGHCQFILPPWLNINLPKAEMTRQDLNDFLADICSTPEGMEIWTPAAGWLTAMMAAEFHYQDLRKIGWSPQQARSVLPCSTKTEVVMSANYREWRHVFALRCAETAHPQMREVMIPLRDQCKLEMPEVFGDL